MTKFQLSRLWLQSKGQTYIHITNVPLNFVNKKKKLKKCADRRTALKKSNRNYKQAQLRAAADRLF